MKIVTIPETKAKYKIRVRQGANGPVEELEAEPPFIDFLKAACDMYKQFAAGPKQARQYDKIMCVIEAVNGEKVIRFEDDDHAVVLAAVNDASWLTPEVNRAYFKAGYYDAVEKAEHVKVP